MSRDVSYRLLATARRSILAATLLGVAAACVVRSVLALDWLFVAKAATVLCSVGLLLPLRLSDHHPFAKLGIANHITIARGVLVILLAGCIGEGTAPELQGVTLCVAAIAASLDAFDGWAARRTNMASSYGARFDMETDALLILVLSLLVWQFGKAGAWVLGSGLMRYVFVTAALFLPWLRSPLPPSRRRKVVAVVQVVSLLISVAPFIAHEISQWLCASTLVALAWSFLVDVTWLNHVKAVPAKSIAVSS